jgi:hypothetical protein
VGLVDDVRAAAAWVTDRARLVRLDADRLSAYARELPGRAAVPALDPDAHLLDGALEDRAAFFLTLDAVNFGSGWFPTLRKRDRRSGYFTVAVGVRERFSARGPWSARELAAIGAPEVAAALRQDPGHELMGLFAASLRGLGARVRDEHAGRFLGVVEAASGSAVALAEALARWPCFADVSRYESRVVPFLKRAQIAASDLELGGVAAFGDSHRLTLFADNLIPHVLRVDGILRFDPAVAARIDAGELLVHDAPEEVEMRAGAVQAAELICRERPDLDPRTVDQILWTRGGGERYKALPRPRVRTTAY